MLNSKNYLIILFVLLGMIVTTTVGYSVYFAKHYPVPIMDHISFDAKLKFIRDDVDIENIDTIIIGSSLALNNVHGVVLEQNSKNCKHVLNYSVWSISALEVEQMLELTSIFPKLERIIYSGQFTSLHSAKKFKNFDSDFLKKYMQNTLSPIEYASFVANACKDISFCREREKEWEKKHLDNTKYTYLDFDHTGSILLHIYGKDIIGSRWSRVDSAGQNSNALKALERIAKNAQDRNIKFYFVQQPYRQAPIDKHKHVQNIMKSFPKNMKYLVEKYQGTFFNLHDNLHLDDTHFADRSHLNDKGSKVSTEALAKLIDKTEK